MSRKEHSDIARIISQRPWLSEKHNELRNLLFVECETDDHRALVSKILCNSMHIDLYTYRNLMKLLADDITKTVSDPEKTLLVSMTGDRSADSGQHVLYALKYYLAALKWTGYTTVNQYNHSHKVFKENKETDLNLILVDNFIGSGKTVLSRLAWINQTFNQFGYAIPKIYVKVALCTRTGHDVLINAGINLYASQIVEDKLIDNLFNSEKDKYIELMKNIEEKLLKLYYTKKGKPKTVPSLGYGGAQVAISIEDMNTPNNVFPIFWWQYSSNHKERDVILIRDMEDA